MVGAVIRALTNHVAGLLAPLALGAAAVLAGCGAQPLLHVGAQRIVVEPNGSATAHGASVSYTIGQPAHLTVLLRQPSGQELQLRSIDRAPDTYALAFDGVVGSPGSPDQRVLPDGTYQLIFQAHTPGGQSATQFVQAVVRQADPVPLVLNHLALTLPVFSPNGQGVRPVPPMDGPPGDQQNLDQTTLDYAVSKSADIFIWVTDAHGNSTPLHSQLARNTKAGDQSFIWDGRDPNGMVLADGTYQLHVRATDASGNVAEQAIPVTIVHSGVPNVQIVSAGFSPTTLGNNGVLHVEVTVRNSGNVAIKTLGPPAGTAYTTHMSYLDPSFNKPGDVSPPFVDTRGRWRVAVRWTSGPQDYPVRWAFFADDSQELQPGQQVTVRGTIKILPPQPSRVVFSAAVEMGGVGFTSDYGQTTVTIGIPTQG